MVAPTLPTPPERSSDQQILPREVSIRKLLAVAALIVLAVGSVSYVRALMAPGYASWNDKTSSWIRDHGGGPALNAYENWRYASPPPDTPPDPSQFASAAAIPGGTTTSFAALPVLPTVAGSPAPTWSPDVPEQTEFPSPTFRTTNRARRTAARWPGWRSSPARPPSRASSTGRVNPARTTTPLHRYPAPRCRILSLLSIPVGR
ncbi:hypothetical protein [Rhodococcoides fascians]|uniref:hypothetical protein n=1 Tax=Rhodococcoides fascians TaxID=1828 RepID=UPI0015C6556D|nr:hypothetical protein [Rhodococcus fascians]